MKQLTIILLLAFLSTNVLSQSEINEIVQKGIELHDNGDYDLAIRTYKKALKLDPNSVLVNYEIAMSYLEVGEYKKTIKHTDVVLGQKTEFSQGAYVIKGSALDLQGKTKKSIKLFESALEETGENYLLAYNLAVNYFKLGDTENAEKNAIRAIDDNPNHASSHLMLVNIHNAKGNSVQTLLAAYYFLFLEPNTARADEVYELLQDNYGSNVSTDGSEPNALTISLSPDSEFSAAELSISLLNASSAIKDSLELNDVEEFEFQTSTFFNVMGNLKEDQDDIWWSFYTPFFAELAESKHLTKEFGEWLEGK